MSCSSTSNEWPYNYNYNRPSYNNSFTIQDSLSHHSSSLMDSSLRYSRQIKKSRASRKTQATIFNADVANFRTLVQQLTGRPTAPTVLGAHKGPVTINFSQEKIEDQLGVETSCSTMLPFGHGNNYARHIAPVEHENRHIVLDRSIHDKDVKMSLSNNGQSCVASSSSIGVVDPSSSLDLLDDFDVHGCLEELDLDWVASTNDVGNGHW
ncbi:hypothetical protein vseg_010719 [Gypsophila vaccaria]